MHTVILGLAKSGTSIAHYLIKKNKKIIITDKNEIENKQEWENKGIKVIEGHHPIELLENCEQIVKNPGIPYQIPFLKEAKKRGIPILTEIEIAYQTLKVPIIGITGSNGKTTVTHLIYEMLKKKGLKTVKAGNIGLPLIETVQMDLDVIVCELSSFQLMGTKSFRPFVSVLTNIHPNHLDYHENLEEYVQAKIQIQKNQNEQNFFIYNEKLDHLNEHWNPKVKKIYFSFEHQLKDSNPNDRTDKITVKNQKIVYGGDEILDINDIQLKGDHNLENYLAAIGVAKLFDVSHQDIQNVAKTFTGVPYRLEKIYEKNDIDIYNDSKSTNSESAITAIKSFSKPIHWIAGGKDRGEDFENIVPFLTHVQQMYVYGETKEILKKLAIQKHIKIFESNTLEECVKECLNQVNQKESILFSPACASWDQYPNFEIRGESFRGFVQKYKAYLDK